MLPGASDVESGDLHDATLVGSDWAKFRESALQYLHSHRALLDAADAIDVHLDSVVRVGAQAATLFTRYERR